MYGVQKGFSMLDWGLLSAKATNLSGQKGTRPITIAEVKQHSSEHDCWSVFRGRVYNITPFLAYHPGGKAELMKGAGRDCTALFNKYHPWVNAESLMGNLLIGVLATEDGEGKEGDSGAAKEPRSRSGEGKEGEDE